MCVDGGVHQTRDVLLLSIYGSERLAFILICLLKYVKMERDHIPDNGEFIEVNSRSYRYLTF